MKAAYYEGERIFSVRDGQAPDPGPGEVRLNVAYCGLCGTDVHIFHGVMDRRVRIPQVIGHEMSGVVQAIGPDVRGFTPGDAVTVRPLDYRSEPPGTRRVCHISPDLKFMGIDSPGALQSSWTVPAGTLHRLPAGMDMRRGALIEPLAVACHAARRGRLAADERAVVLGGGPIGLLVALVARATGAQVLLSEINPHRRELAQQLGFETVDPGAQDLEERVPAWTGAAGADVVFEVSGAAAAAQRMSALAGIRGRLVIVAIFPEPVPFYLFPFFWKEVEMIGARVYEPEDFEQAIALAGDEHLPLEALITAVEPLENLPAAFAELEANPRAMKVLIRCNEEVDDVRT